MTTVGELIHSLKKSDVLATLARLYEGPGESPEGYVNVWDTLVKMQPKTTKMSVVLSQSMSSDEPPEPWVDVSGSIEGDSQIYAIECTDWSEWLSMPVIVDVKLGNIPDMEKLAHCLYEMTWSGYIPAHIEKKLEDICDLVEEAKADLSNRAH